MVWDKENNWDRRVVVVENQVLELHNFEDHAPNTLDVEWKYLNNGYDKDRTEGPHVEERIYRCIFRSDFSTTGTLDMNQVHDFLNTLIKSNLNHNHHVKRISYNTVPDDAMIIAETGVYANDDIVGTI